MSIEIRGLREDELEVHDQLVYDSYAEFITQGRGYLSDPGWWLRCITRDPYYAPEQTRVLFADGVMVASVSNYLRETYCAGRRARLGAIGSVATHPDHRRKGYVRQLLDASREWMRDNAFDASFLFGRQEVYGGSGWEMFSAFETFAALRPPTEDTGLTVRQADFTRDLPALCAIYDDFNAALTGTFARSEAYWQERVCGGYFADHSPEYFVLEASGEPLAYCRTTAPGSVAELGWRRADATLPPRVIGAILRQWPEAEETHFALCTHELLAALEPHIWAPTAAAYGEKQSALRLVERYKGLWTYIGPGEGNFPEFADTPGLLRFLHEHEYAFWSGVDSF